MGRSKKSNNTNGGGAPSSNGAGNSKGGGAGGATSGSGSGGEGGSTLPKAGPGGKDPSATKGQDKSQLMLELKTSGVQFSVQVPHRPKANLSKKLLNAYFDKIFPIRAFQEQLSPADLLKLRLVCRAWLKSMESYWDTLHDDLPEEEEEELPCESFRSILGSPNALSLSQPPNSFNRSRNVFPFPLLENFKGAAALLEGTEGFQGNPFIARRACLHCPYEDSGERNYWAMVVPLLKKFGKELRVLEILYESQSPTEEMIFRVKECLQWVPQLVSLRLMLLSAQSEGNDGCFLPIVGLPELPQLQRLSVTFRKIPLYHAVAVYFNQLVSLKLLDNFDFLNWYEPKIHDSFPKLKHISVVVANQQNLEKVSRIEGPLKEVEIQSWIRNLPPVIYLQLMEKFGDTLCSLKMSLDLDCAVPLQAQQGSLGCDCGWIHLPKLKALGINILECGYEAWADLELLSRPPQYLEMIVESCSTRHNQGGFAVSIDEKEDPLQILKSYKNMYTSGIWAEWPELQELYVFNFTMDQWNPHRGVGMHYTRDQLEHVQNGGGDKQSIAGNDAKPHILMMSSCLPPNTD